VASPQAFEKTRPLHIPRRLRVEADDTSGDPLAVHLSGRRLSVEAVLERWRVEDEWWRERPVARLYYRVLLEDGRTLDVYRALRTGTWFRQAY
jgi:hypothetical protein